MAEVMQRQSRKQAYPTAPLGKGVGYRGLLSTEAANSTVVGANPPG